MTRETFETNKFLFECEYEMESRKLKRQFEAKNAREIGFLTPHMKALLKEQRLTTNNAKLQLAISDLRKDLETKHFGVKGIKGWEKELFPAFKIIIPST